MTDTNDLKLFNLKNMHLKKQIKILTRIKYYSNNKSRFHFRLPSVSIANISRFKTSQHQFNHLLKRT